MRSSFTNLENLRHIVRVIKQYLREEYYNQPRKCQLKVKKTTTKQKCRVERKYPWCFLQIIIRHESRIRINKTSFKESHIQCFV
jgi:hypothetical protein